MAKRPRQPTQTPINANVVFPKTILKISSLFFFAFLLEEMALHAGVGSAWERATRGLRLYCCGGSIEWEDETQKI